MKVIRAMTLRLVSRFSGQRETVYGLDGGFKNVFGLSAHGPGDLSNKTQTLVQAALMKICKTDN